MVVEARQQSPQILFINENAHHPIYRLLSDLDD
jgi:hypothetical protein